MTRSSLPGYWTPGEIAALCGISDRAILYKCRPRGRRGAQLRVYTLGKSRLIPHVDAIQLLRSYVEDDHPVFKEPQPEFPFWPNNWPSPSYPTSLPGYWTPGEIAAWCGVTERAITYRCKTNGGITYHDLGRFKLIPHTEALRFICTYLSKRKEKSQLLQRFRDAVGINET